MHSCCVSLLGYVNAACRALGQHGISTSCKAVAVPSIGPFYCALSTVYRLTLGDRTLLQAAQLCTVPGKFHMDLAGEPSGETKVTRTYKHYTNANSWLLILSV